MVRISSVFALLLFLVACTPKNDISSLELDVSPVISREQRVALVIDPYIALRDKPGENGITIAHARRGDVFLVSGKKIEDSDGASTLWIDLGSGWVRDSSLQFYSSEARARAAGKSLSGQNGNGESRSGTQ